MKSARTPVKRNKIPALVAAAAMSAAGISFTAPVPAQAAPCNQWGFPNGGNGFTNNLGQSLLFQAGGKSVTQAPASWVGPNGTKGSGYLNGAITGRGLSFTWKGDGGPPKFSGGATITFAGTVNNDGSVGGTVSYSEGSPGSFTSKQSMTCLDAPPGQAPAPPPAAVPAPAATPPPTNAISVNFEKRNNGLRVNVNNSSAVTGSCTYDATAPNSLIPPFHKDFTVAAKGGTNFDISGIPTGTQYNTVTSCHGDFNGKDVQIGRVELTERF
jgi:hypothetical protein